MVTDLEKRLDVGIVGIPFRQPLGGKTSQADSHQEILADRTGGQYLLPLGDLMRRLAFAEHGHNHWGTQKPFSQN